MAFDIASDKTRAAKAVQTLYQSIRRDIESDGDGWNGADVVELLCQWFQLHGFDVDGPNPWGETDKDDNE